MRSQDSDWASQVLCDGDTRVGVLRSLSYGVDLTVFLAVQLPLVSAWFLSLPLLWWTINELPTNSFSFDIIQGQSLVFIIKNFWWLLGISCRPSDMQAVWGSLLYGLHLTYSSHSSDLDLKIPLSPEPHPYLPHLDQVRCPCGMSLYHSVFLCTMTFIIRTCECLLSCLHHGMQDIQALHLFCLPLIFQGPGPSIVS